MLPNDQNNKKDYLITGMDCTSCAKTIEKGVSKLPHISKVTVHFSSGKMEVEALDATAFQAIPKQVKQLGYGIAKDEMKKETFRIDGMDCANCAKTIEKGVQRLADVRSVHVQFTTGKMVVEHSTKAGFIEKNVSKLGYQATLAESNKEVKEKTITKVMNIPLLISTFAILIGFISHYLLHVPKVSAGFFLVALIISGYHPAKSALFAIRAKSLDMNVLMSVAAIGAVLIGEWSEGAMVVWLFEIGAYLQKRSVEITKNSLQDLMDLTPEEAFIMENDSIVSRPIATVAINERVLIRPFDRVPLDGVVLVGNSAINQAPITGESMPVSKKKGDSVFAGTMNEAGTLEISVTKTAANSTITEIVKLVEDAQEKKAPAEAFIDKFAAIYTPIVFVLAFFVMFLPPLIGFGSFESWIYKGLELLVIACPCALVISTPVAIVSAIGRAATKGVLIKGGTSIEVASKITAIAFDKTGTITKGEPQIVAIETFSGTEEALLQTAFTLEQYSGHPLATAIISESKRRNIEPFASEEHQNKVGVGVTATILGETYFAGKIDRYTTVLSARQREFLESKRQVGKTIVAVGTMTEVLGIIIIMDTLRKNLPAIMTDLTHLGIKKKILLTGDNYQTAAMIAKEAQMNQVYAELMPADKMAQIAKVQQDDEIAMVGDGINDAPALAAANLGIAVKGIGTNVAVEAADAVLMSGNLDKLPFVFRLSKQTMQIIKQNIGFAILIKALAFILVFPGLMTLWLAVLSDSGAAVLVVLNALRLIKTKE